MTGQDIFALAIVLAAVAYLARSAYRALANRRASCCDKGCAAQPPLVQIRPTSSPTSPREADPGE
jgi:hypothetical protein